MALPTSSFRAPAEFHTLIHEIARALRHRPDLAEPLRALLATVADSDVPADALPSWAGLARRLDALERQLAEHGALLAARPVVQAEALPGMPALQAEALPTGTAAAPAPVEPWTAGEGRLKRLTTAGLAELDKRLAAGDVLPQRRAAGGAGA